MLSKDDTEKIFELARIEVNKEELERFPQELDAILRYVSELQKAPLGDAPPTLSFAPAAKKLRQDLAGAPNSGVVNRAIQQFPETKNGFLKTKKVFGD